MLNKKVDALGSLATVLPAAAIYSDLFCVVTLERRHNLLHDKFLNSELRLDERYYNERTRLAKESYDSGNEWLREQESTLNRLASILGIALEN